MAPSKKQVRDCCESFFHLRTTSIGERIRMEDMLESGEEDAMMLFLNA